MIEGVEVARTDRPTGGVYRPENRLRRLPSCFLLVRVRSRRVHEARG